MIERRDLKLLAEPAVRFAQCVIGQAREQVMERMIAQSDRSPECRESRGRRHVDAVQELRRDAHWIAVILPKVRNECPDLV
jgi:hypothetical protein